MFTTTILYKVKNFYKHYKELINENMRYLTNIENISKTLNKIPNNL